MIFQIPRFVRVNVHVVLYDQLLYNENTTRVGVVIDNHGRRIIEMVLGTVDHCNHRANELWTILLGFLAAYGEIKNNMKPETEAGKAVMKWKDCRWFIDKRHPGIIEQLN